jgi:predicted ATP-dependent protease
MRFGVGIRHSGYNLFVLGPHGEERLALATALLNERAATEAVPGDCCYVNNFEEPSRPKLLMVPAGIGVALRAHVEHLTEELCSAVPASFESEEFRKRRQAIEDELKNRRENVLREFRDRAAGCGLALVETPNSVAFAAKKGQELLDHDDFHKLPEEEQQRITNGMQQLGKEFLDAMRDAPKWESEMRAKIKALARDTTTAAIRHLIEAVRSRYQELPQVVAYLDALQRDVIEHANDFLPQPAALAEMLSLGESEEGLRLGRFRRYRVNVLVSHAGDKSAPVIVEENPTHVNLLGQVDYIAHLGALITDFNLIKPGALHRANGGYLLLDARHVLAQPFAWDALKRALRGGELRIESLASMIGFATTATIRPEPLPLDVKVVLVGEPLLYYILSAFDPEFGELFKVAAEFDGRMDRSRESELTIARMIATIARRESLLPFDRGAMARIVEQCARWSGHAAKVSTHLARLGDLLRQADYWARQEKHTAVTAADVDHALDHAVHRISLLSERITEEIRLGTICIDTDGERVGQINGISAFALGDQRFGRPVRITATVSPGSGEVIDVDREAKLGGPIHSKGVLILSGFIAGRFAVDFPLSLGARIVFEQSYSEVEGDSASSAELYALLSAIANVPLRQSFATTGSVNQHGVIQAIGAVNEKIEGFFDVCKAQGLTGRQGVLIPRANLQHLMLRHDVIEAVEAERFHIHAVGTIDEGLEVLTGITAGGRGPNGIYPPATINGVVQMRLVEMAQTRMTYQMQPAAGGDHDG